MFRHLRTKLTILYAALFGFTLIVIATAVFIGVANNATRVVSDELQANGQVFNRLWQMRSDQLHDGADVLSRDFGFRTAVASGDVATIGSALDNLRARLGLDRAFLVQTDGSVVGLNLPVEQRTALWQTLDNSDDAAGVLTIDGAPYQAVAAPVRAPTTIGWVVFAAALNSARMRSFEELAPIDILAQVFTREPGHVWVGHDLADRGDLPVLSRLLSRRTNAVQQIDLRDGHSIAVALSLPSMTPKELGSSTALILSYPMARALAPYNVLIILVIGVGILGLAMVVLGSWALARSLTKPITQLDEAAIRLQRGEDVHVELKSNDEIARLANSFNTMASGIKERERRIRVMALSDGETRLPNRRAFEAALRKTLRTRAPVAVAMFSVNRYGFMRDAIGYELAAELMRGLGERLGASFSGARVGRVSETSFGLLLATADPAQALKSARSIQRQLEAPLRLGDLAIDVMTTAGVALGEGVSFEPAALITKASVAVDQARGKNRKAAVFDAALYGDPRSNLALISELYDAMQSGDAWLVYQPKYDIRSQRITGAEALMRWRHPRRGMISPDLFIGMAEETGHIRGLTEWVLRTAIADQLRLGEAGHDLTMSVNISGRLLDDHAFTERSLQIIHSAGVRACFEITETAALGNSNRVLASIRRWREGGIEVSIDDYGAGLSSLSYLKALQAHELKIDKSFVMALQSSQRDALLVKSTIDLAHGLGMKVTAEGVETETTLALLASMGCDVAQGYFIGKPMTASELIEFQSDDVPARAIAVSHRSA